MQKRVGDAMHNRTLGTRLRSMRPPGTAILVTHRFRQQQ